MDIISRLAMMWGFPYGLPNMLFLLTSGITGQRVQNDPRCWLADCQCYENPLASKTHASAELVQHSALQGQKCECITVQSYIKNKCMFSGSFQCCPSIGNANNCTRPHFRSPSSWLLLDTLCSPCVSVLIANTSAPVPCTTSTSRYVLYIKV